MSIFKAFMALVLAMQTLSATISAANLSAEENIKIQQERMAYLENEFYSDYTPGDERRFTSFNLDAEIESGVKFNEVRFLATHNSYQLAPTDEYRTFYTALSDATFGLINDELLEFEMETLTEQFEMGIRSVELDIETVDDGNEVSFIVCHNPLNDNTSSCYDFETALKEIKMWSDNNPGHLPITVIIEPKRIVPPVNNLKPFRFSYAVRCDEIVREIMGDTLLTPKDMMGDYKSLKEMRENDGWLPLGETMGKVIFYLHDSDATSGYINQDKSLKSQAMFPMLRYMDRNKSYASVIIDNVASEAAMHKTENIDKCKVIVRVRADSFPDYSEKRYAQTEECMAQIVSTDYPVKKGEAKYHQYSFDGYTVTLQK